MNGKLTTEICDMNLNCCNTGNLDSSRDDFNGGNVDVFWGSMIGDCEDFEMSEGAALMIVTHDGLDAWKGDWIR